MEHVSYCLFVCLFVCLFFVLFFCLVVCLFVCLFVCLYKLYSVSAYIYCDESLVVLGRISIIIQTIN